MSQNNTGTAIFLRSGDVPAWRFAVDLAGAAVSNGDAVTLVLFDQSLGTLLSNGAGFAPIALDIRLVRDLAKMSGSFQRIACSGAVERVGADPDALVDGGLVDDVMGLPAIWRLSRAMRLTVI